MLRPNYNTTFECWNILLTTECRGIKLIINLKQKQMKNLKLAPKRTTCLACGHVYTHGFCPCGGYGEIEETLA